MIKYPYSFGLTPKALEFFKRERILLKYPFKIDDVHPIGGKLTVSAPVYVERYANMPVGSFLSMGAYSYCQSRIDPTTRIGRYCSIAKGVEVLGIEHPTDWITSHTLAFRGQLKPFFLSEFGSAPTPRPHRDKFGPIEIGHDVWIGQDVRIRSGVKIGTGAVIASGAVVTKDVAPYMIVGGVSARPIRSRFPDAMVERLLASEWWAYNAADFDGLPFDKPEQFLDGLAERVAAGTITKWEPGVLDLAAELDAFLKQ